MLIKCQIILKKRKNSEVQVHLVCHGYLRVKSGVSVWFVPVV